MLNFCTLFDSNYLAKGLAMYYSLERVCPNFHLYIFSFDDKSDILLKQLALINVTVISLTEFEDQHLLEIKSTRTKAEYCWTCTPSTILYCLKNFEIEHCTYIDADLFFFTDPKILIEEMGNDDVLIIEHKYSPQYDQSHESGKYCVQFMCFKKTENGLNVLNWWRDACIGWCYNRKEDGKFGDQKYLDDWLIRFDGIHELKHLGGGVAPWNVQQYKVFFEGTVLTGINQISGMKFDLVFYHFHHLNNKRIDFIDEFNLGPYFLSKDVLRNIYKPYIEELKQICKNIHRHDSSIDGLGSDQIYISGYRLLFHLIKNSFRTNKLIWINKWRN